MTIRLVIAPAGCGKTACAVAALRALPPLAAARVLVPDQLEAEAFRRRMAQAGGALGVRVQTFYGLYADILAQHRPRLSRPLPQGGMAYLMPAVRQRLIQHLAEELHAREGLPYYAPVRGSAGFARLLGELWGEFKRARITPERLSGALSGKAPRLRELASLYAAYQAWLQETGWIDADGQGWLAEIALDQNPALFADLALLVVDGFDEFNPTQLALLRTLVQRAGETLITLDGDLDRPARLAHRRQARAYAALREAIDVEPERIPRPEREPALAHLESALFEPGAAPVDPGESVAFLEAQSRAAEAREAVRWLKARIVREGVPLSGAAIVARSISPYRPFLHEAGAEFGVPLHVISPAPLRDNPAVAALVNLLYIPLEPDPWSPRRLLDALTSPYLDWSDAGWTDPGDADRLYDAARAGRVIAGRDQWREALGRRAAQRADPDRTLDAEKTDDALSPPRPPTAREAERLAALFERLAAYIEPPPAAALRERVAWLEDLIGSDPLQPGGGPGEGSSLRVVERARDNRDTAERDVAALGALKDVLRALILSAEILGSDGGEPAPPERFVQIIVQAIDQGAYATPAGGDALLVATALEARGLTFDSVALLGLSEGDFAAPQRQDPLLRESDRVALRDEGLPVEPRLRGDESSFFYQAVTRARRRLLLCRPYLADDGQPWEASPYWLAALRLFDPPPVIHVRPTDPVRDPASEREWAALHPTARARDAAVVIAARRSENPSPWNGDLSSLGERLAARYAPDRPWSASRLEAYARCPLLFWTAHVLELEAREPPQAGLDPLILGSIYHRVLEELYTLAPDGDADRLRAALDGVAAKVYRAAPEEYGFRPTPLWERQQEELTETLRQTVEALVAEAGAFQPLAQELPFGLHRRPPLVIEGDPPLRLRGFIDRVDRAPDGRLRVIDYKTGSTPISPRDLSRGQRLQLPLYALAAQQALQAEVSSGFYWHIGAAEASRLRLESYRAGPEGAQGVAGAIETAVRHAREIAARVRAGQFAPQPPDGGCPAYCPAAAFCERYRPAAW